MGELGQLISLLGSPIAGVFAFLWWLERKERKALTKRIEKMHSAMLVFASQLGKPVDAVSPTVSMVKDILSSQDGESDS